MLEGSCISPATSLTFSSQNQAANYQPQSSNPILAIDHPFGVFFLHASRCILFTKNFQHSELGEFWAPHSYHSAARLAKMDGLETPHGSNELCTLIMCRIFTNEVYQSVSNCTVGLKLSTT